MSPNFMVAPSQRIPGPEEPTRREKCWQTPGAVGACGSASLLHGTLTTRLVLIASDHDFGHG